MVSPPKDAKTVLQEWSQSKKNVHLTYVVVKESGPPHRPIFTIGLRINGYDEVLGKSNTKKAAEQKAAEVFIKKHNIKAED